MRVRARWSIPAIVRTYGGVETDVCLLQDMSGRALETAPVDRRFPNISQAKCVRVCVGVQIGILTAVFGLQVLLQLLLGVPSVCGQQQR